MDELLEWDELSFAEKVLLKKMAESDFLMFQRIFFQLLQGDKWGVNWHHRLIAKKVEEVILNKTPDGVPRNKVFNVPPGSGKTEMFSIHAPVWGVLRTRKVRNLNISFSDTLAKRNSRRTREIITSREFQELWPMSIGVNQADEWQLLNAEGKIRAEVISRSAAGQITGSRAGYPTKDFSGMINLDDFDKPNDVFSEIKRKKNHELLSNTIRSRRGNKSKHFATPIVAIQQRLHVDDSSAFMLAGGMGMDFEPIVIPALVDEAYIDSLPEWLRDDCWNTVKDTEKMRGYWSYWPDNEYIGDLIKLWDIDDYTFMSQYMQKPISLGGNVFNGDWWKYYGEDEDPATLPRPKRFEYRFITGDTAQKIKEHNDWSVFCLWGKYEDKIYLLDMIRNKWEAPELETNFIAFVNSAYATNYQDGYLQKIYIEDKVSGTGLIQSAGKKIPITITALQRNKDKAIRARDAQPVVKAGRVVLPVGAKWLPEFLAEHAAFTYDDSHKHDDMVDNTIDAATQELMIGTNALERLKALIGQ